MGKRKVESEEKATIAAPSTSNNEKYDSSDEEDLRNTIGNIPVEWYDDVDHVGYDLYGERITKQGSAKGEIDTFLTKLEDPDYWRSIFDRQIGSDTKLTDEQIEKLKSISMHRYPQLGYNPYTEFLDIYSSKTEIHPISNRPEDKRSFIPSADERRLVGRMVHAIKMGWTKKPEKEEKPKVYDLWSSESDNAKSKSELARIKMHWPAPKVTLPTHAESYNPPSEYLLDENELKKWNETEPEKRRISFVPQKYDALRKVPAYDKFYNERFERCLDLYLAPRQLRMKLNVDPNQLLPELPNPQDLQPFPTTLAFYMRGHNGQVRSISIEPEKGELLASGGEDSTVRLWYLPTGRCVRTFNMSAPVTCVAYCPDPQKTLVLVSCESNIVTILNADCGDKLQVSSTKNYMNSLEVENDDNQVKWKRTSDSSIEIALKDKIRQAVWHKRGDYFATVSFEASSDTVYIHQLSKCSSQKPFSKKKGHIQYVLFHPTQPLFFVATQQHVRIYDLAKCQLKKKLFTGSRWISCMQLDTHGNNLFVGGLDKVFSWIDMELSTKPWKSLKNHSAAIRSLSFHRRYPLLATASDDGTAIIYHARIPQDLMRDNELIPVKRLFGHGSQQRKKKSDDKPPLTILSVVFHPNQPWLITAGADGLIGLFTY